MKEKAFIYINNKDIKKVYIRHVEGLKDRLQKKFWIMSLFCSEDTDDIAIMSKKDLKDYTIIKNQKMVKLFLINYRSEEED